MILDATAGNRTMYRTKSVEQIIYIDMERKLTIPPTLLCNNIMAPFKDKSFSTIIFDPPHGWGEGHYFYRYPDAESFHAKWAGYGKVPRYYGWDKLDSKNKLLKYLFEAQREFLRLLEDDGLLWLKWNEVKIKLWYILPLFRDWHELLRIRIDPKIHTAGKRHTYWLCLCKKKGSIMQASLC